MSISDSKCRKTMHIGTQRFTWLISNEMQFKIDTGADVSCLPETTYQQLKCSLGELKSSKKKLFGADRKGLLVIGTIEQTLTVNENSVKEILYVVKGLKEPLLGRPAIEGLNLIARVNEVSTGPGTPRVKQKKSTLTFFMVLANLKGTTKSS